MLDPAIPRGRISKDRPIALTILPSQNRCVPGYSILIHAIKSINKSTGDQEFRSLAFL